MTIFSSPTLPTTISHMHFHQSCLYSTYLYLEFYPTALHMYYCFASSCDNGQFVTVSSEVQPLGKYLPPCLTVSISIPHQAGLTCNHTLVSLWIFFFNACMTNSYHSQYISFVCLGISQDVHLWGLINGGAAFEEMFYGFPFQNWERSGFLSSCF